ncbi:substrate-binding domain-containing protein [Methylosinus sp. Sm6]|uniref:substrate-binding domain-containing protein n=1 Tax=Methylosinus sp. Sm6 TaxID=2866948 RepID=UPI001C9951E8|nr:substrate-binding domain-containing protein [Methylosinus sp. Sm6]MBY6243303.1 substrate-binding domain-containing protein [Methylosinus sp. Sm6]
MSILSFSKSLRDNGSLLALSTVLIAAQPAHATDGLFGGGGTLASLVQRQEGDCFYGHTVTGDGYSFNTSTSWAPGLGLLPSLCTTHTTVSTFNVLELYAGVGSGAGLRGYISNDPKQLFRGRVNTGTAAQLVLLPADPPKFLESAGPAPFNAYPYPRLDFGAGDSPLPANLVNYGYGTYGTYTYNATPTTNWQSAASITITRANTTSTVAFSTASFGQPIQLPLFAAGVAVGVNLPAVDASGSATSGGITWNIKSQFSTTAAGGRIQLSTAQICAIFSGLVNDWRSTATIPYLQSNGTTGTESFAASNTWYAAHASHGMGGGTAYVYSSSYFPIKIVYRSDSSGTSYIFTNYLKTVCPLLDPTDYYGYRSIFGTTALPDNSFQKLIDQVTSFVPGTRPSHSLNTIGAAGDDAVAAAIGQSAANYGRIGVLSNNFVAPYNPVTTTRPHAASIQNDFQRWAGVKHPGESGVTTTTTTTTVTAPQNFIAATPASANLAWAILTPPTWTSTWADYDIYAQRYAAGADLNSGNYASTGWVDRYTTTAAFLSITGLSKLPLAPAPGAYPLVGTAYAYVYSCYGNGRDGVAAATRVTDLVNYLNWYYTRIESVATVVYNGFNYLPASWTVPIRQAYLGLGSTNGQWITARSAGAIQGCTGVTGGAQ